MDEESATLGAGGFTIDVFTIFPGMVEGYLEWSLIGRAQARGLVNIFVHDIRSYTTSSGRSVDDTPFGGGAGMVMMAEPIFNAVESTSCQRPLLLLSPSGKIFDQQMARDLSTGRMLPSNTTRKVAGVGVGVDVGAGAGAGVDVMTGDAVPVDSLPLNASPVSHAETEVGAEDATHSIRQAGDGYEVGTAETKGFSLICGRYEGVDQRVMDHLVDGEISIGDYIISGGELAALVVIEATVRLLPGVMGNDESAAEESFEDGLLEYPQYSHPRSFRGWEVPPVLLSGNHGMVSKWRMAQRLKLTARRRPDLIEARGGITDRERELIEWAESGFLEHG